MERKTCTTRIGVIKSRQFAGARACTIIALSIFVIAGREVNGVILPLTGSSANREIVTMRVYASLSVRRVVRINERPSHLFGDRPIDPLFPDVFAVIY